MWGRRWRTRRSAARRRRRRCFACAARGERDIGRLRPVRCSKSVEELLTSIEKLAASYFEQPKEGPRRQGWTSSRPLSILGSKTSYSWILCKKVHQQFYVVRPHNENVLGPGRLLSRERVGAAHTDSGTGSRWGHTVNVMRWYTKRGQTRAALCVQRTGCTGRRGDWVQVRAASLSAGQRSYPLPNGSRSCGSTLPGRGGRCLAAAVTTGLCQLLTRAPGCDCALPPVLMPYRNEVYVMLA